MEPSSDSSKYDIDDLLEEVNRSTSHIPKVKYVNCFLCKQRREVRLDWKLRETCDLCFEALRRVYIAKYSGIEALNTYLRKYDNRHGTYTEPWDEMPKLPDHRGRR